MARWHFWGEKQFAEVYENIYIGSFKLRDGKISNNWQIGESYHMLPQIYPRSEWTKILALEQKISDELSAYFQQLMDKAVFVVF